MRLHGDGGIAPGEHANPEAEAAAAETSQAALFQDTELLMEMMRVREAVDGGDKAEVQANADRIKAIVDELEKAFAPPPRLEEAAAATAELSFRVRIAADADDLVMG